LFEHSGNDLIILCDFDGTISVRDVTDVLLERFGQSGCAELEAAWEAGKIGSRQCMSEQIALLAASRAELDDCLSEVAIDPHFKRFCETVEEAGVTLHIVSDGLDYAIRAVLQRHGLGAVPVFANRLVQTGERNWRLDFPYAAPDCEKKSGHCKCRHVAHCRQHVRRILYIGDGASDYCVSGHVDLVLAKEKLIRYCEQEEIPHHPVTGFADMLRLWPSLWPTLWSDLTPRPSALPANLSANGAPTISALLFETP
jgi:2,3-diketo-5-methylthio-1-phosphopentane phosphatase